MKMLNNNLSKGRLSNTKNLLSSISDLWNTEVFTTRYLVSFSFYTYFFFYLFIFSFIFTSWRLITLQYCSGFCHTLTWISHGFTCVPHPDPHSHLPPHPIPLGLPSAPALSTYLMHCIWWIFLHWEIKSQHNLLLQAPLYPKLLWTETIDLMRWLTSITQVFSENKIICWPSKKK